MGPFVKNSSNLKTLCVNGIICEKTPPTLKLACEMGYFQRKRVSSRNRRKP